MNELATYIQDQVKFIWCMLFIDEIIVVNENREELTCGLERCRELWNLKDLNYKNENNIYRM